MTTRKQAKLIMDTFFNALEARDKARKNGDIKEIIRNQNIIEIINSGNRTIYDTLLMIVASGKLLNLLDFPVNL